jgi:hypothetical protein
LLCASAVASSNKQALIVTTFTTAKAVKLPNGYLSLMMRNIVDQLNRTKYFSDVHLEQAGVSEAEKHKLVLSGEVTAFHAGNRAVRYLSGGP